MRCWIRILAVVAAMAAMVPAMAAGFPVSIENAFGVTTVPAQPKRVVSIGYVEQDFLYQLGVAPVGVRQWWGDHAYATWPWAEDARKAVGATPQVFQADELNLEWVLAQNPDLIVGTFIEMDQAQYDALSKIAPVIALPKGYPAWGAPWQVELRDIDEATSGSTEKSDKIIVDLDARFAKVKADYPQFAGKRAAVVYYGDGGFYTYGLEDSGTRFLTSIGLDFPSALGKGDAESNRIDVSAENLRQLDLDTLLWPINGATDLTRSQVEAMAVYQGLRLSKEGRSVWLDDKDGVYSAALSFQSPLAIEFLLDKLPPAIAQALDSDPKTNTDFRQ